MKIPFFGGSESSKRIERFSREARSAAGLQHPNICTVYDAGQIEGRPFITMAFVTGTPLDHEIDPDRPMSTERVASIVRKIALALDYAHRQGVVHRDLKPANIMVTPEGEPIVMDFGLAKLLGGADENEAKITNDGGILGTPSYMSPEQVRGEIAVIGPKSDIYSLGVVLFELLTGKTPYAGTAGAVMGQILAAPVPPVSEFRSDVPPVLDAACQRAMAKSTADRFATMAELANALEKSIKSVSSTGVVPAQRNSVDFAAPVSQPFTAAARNVFEELNDFTHERSAQRKTRQSRIPLVFACLLAVLGMAATAGFVISRVGSSSGTLIVETDGSTVEAKAKDARLVLTDPDGKERYALSPIRGNHSLDPGQYKIRVEGADEIKLNATELKLKKGGRVTVRIALAKETPSPALPSAITSAPKIDKPLARTFKNAVGMEFILVPKGRSWLGGTSRNKGSMEVIFSTDFYLGKYPVTQKEWTDLMGLNPSHFSPEGKGAEAVRHLKGFELQRYPVENITWEECEAFVGKLNQKSNETGWVYRLPTADEWEYACRGGPVSRPEETAFDFYFENPTNQLTRSNANFGKGELGVTSAVHQYPCNSLGFYDMHGNVHQRCYGRSAVVGDISTEDSVIRGGSFWSPAAFCRAKECGRFPPEKRQFNVGLRVACVPAQ